MSLSLKDLLRAGFSTRQGQALLKLGGGASVAPDVVHVGVYGNAAPSSGADVSLELVAQRRAMATTVPQTLGAGEGGGLVPYLNAYGVDLSTHADLAGRVELAVSNADGTEKLIVWANDNLPLTDLTNPVMTEWDVREQVGTDLALSADGTAIESTAGGQFFASVHYRVVAAT